MDFNPPTAADFAWGESQRNRDKLKELERRVSELEERHDVTMLLLAKLIEAWSPEEGA